ncbi:MAG: hypothetical protein HQL42_19920, partial [Alphaproteobacteria bacterium]|nr:hypothetical protein [Alphaproteobacteria bacterium]
MPPELAPDQLLRWYIDAGADETIGEVAMNRFQAQPPPRPVPAAVAAAAPPPRPDRLSARAEEKLAVERAVQG